MLHGRQEELQALGRLVAEASAGRGRALIVQGDAGVGKTALLRRAVAAASSGTRVLTCSGVQAEVALAFSGLQVHVLAAVVQRERAARPPRRRTSAVYRAEPVTLSRASTRLTGAPLPDSGISVLDVIAHLRVR
ncbi:AAA family ATPase [Streptomyces avermitilis]